MIYPHAWVLSVRCRQEERCHCVQNPIASYTSGDKTQNFGHLAKDAVKMNSLELPCCGDNILVLPRGWGRRPAMGMARAGGRFGCLGAVDWI